MTPFSFTWVLCFSLHQGRSHISCMPGTVRRWNYPSPVCVGKEARAVMAVCVLAWSLWRWSPVGVSLSVPASAGALCGLQAWALDPRFPVPFSDPRGPHFHSACPTRASGKRKKHQRYWPCLCLKHWCFVHQIFGVLIFPNITPTYPWGAGTLKICPWGKCLSPCPQPRTGSISRGTGTMTGSHFYHVDDAPPSRGSLMWFCVI